MAKYLGIFCAILICLIAASALAHPYMPLKIGAITISRYSFRVEGGVKGAQPENTIGSMTIKGVGMEQRNGKEYLQFVTSYKDIPYMKAETTLWRREENGNLYLGQKRDSGFFETLEIPADTAIGKEWDYDDGVKSRRKITAHLALDLPGGEKLTDCIEVTRTVLNNSGLNDVVDKGVHWRHRRSLHIEGQY